jgi:hypothetical protein
VWTEGLCDHIGNEDAARNAEDDLDGSPCPLTSQLRQHDERSRGREEWLGMADEPGAHKPRDGCGGGRLDHNQPPLP